MQDDFKNTSFSIWYNTNMEVFMFDININDEERIVRADFENLIIQYLNKHGIEKFIPDLKVFLINKGEE